eukprot:455804_1
MAHRKSKFQEFPPGDEEERTFQIKVKDTPLQSTSDVIFYFYHKHRLLHPNELERIQMEGERIILIFLNVELAMIFYMKCFHPQTPPKDKFELIFGPVNFRSESYIHRNCMRLDACVLQRPVYPKLSPLKTRTKARAISRYNALCIMRFDKNACVCTILNQPYSNPNNRNTPLHRLPPPMLERFELNKHKVENYFIAENKDCITIDFSLKELPAFSQYGIIAMDKTSHENNPNQSDKEIINDAHKSKHICPYIQHRDYCQKHRDYGACPYKYHPQMEQNVHFGNDTTAWINPLWTTQKILSLPSARKAPTNISDEFISYIAPGDAPNACLSLQDVIHNCFILRVTVFKLGNAIRKAWYERKLSERFTQINPPPSMIMDTKQQVPYPLILPQHKDWFISPLHYTQRKEMSNSDYRASMIHFLKELNANNGEYHLEAFCLQACLINYPPIFIIEDFDGFDLNVLQRDITTDESGKVWQILKKLSEGNFEDIKWKEIQSSGKQDSGRGIKGNLDRNISRDAAACRERYCNRGNGHSSEGRNASFMHIYLDLYCNIDVLNELNKHDLGRIQNRFEWVKTLSITPLYYHLVVDQEKSCRMFRLNPHHDRVPITFLRVEFRNIRRGPRFSNEWKHGSFTRQQVQRIMANGICCAGAKYDFFFFSDPKDKKCWFYSLELSRAFNSIKALRNNMGNFEDILNPGKKMSRMGLYNTKCTALTTLKLSDIEVIDDPHAKNGKQLTDGCCIINERITRTNIGHPVVSMLSRFGGAKCMLVSLPSSLIAKVIRRDQDHKRKHYLTEIDKEKQKIHPNQSKLVEWDMILRENENRNFKAQAVITESSMKFQFEKFSLEVAVASFTESKGAFMNREFIAAGYYHYYRKDQTKQFEDHLQRYALKWFGILNAARTTHDYDRIPRQAAEIFVYQESHKRRNKYLLQDMQKWNTGPFITRKHDHRSIQKLVKESWVKAVEKLRIGLPWPSCKIEGVADWTQTLAEHEIFLKIKVPPTTAVLCPQCPLKFDPFMFVCSNCRSPRPKYYVYEGECGLLKSPCMHPRSYKRFTAVYNQLLDDLFDGECLLFSTSPECKTSPVFAMSGADLDGDDFLVVTQQELIPLHDGELADVEVQKFDEQGVRADPEYIDDHTMIDYFLEYALLENTAELAVLHEAFSEHHVEGIGHHQCIEIAKYHSFALDFSKTGKPGILPDELGIPTLVDVRTDQLIIYPHYMGKHPCFRSRMIKGRVYDFVVSQLPMEYYKDCKIYKDHELQRMPDKPRLHKVAPQKIEKAYHNDNMMNRRRDGNMDNEEMEEYEFEWMKPPI